MNVIYQLPSFYPPLSFSTGPQPTIQQCRQALLVSNKLALVRIGSWSAMIFIALQRVVGEIELFWHGFCIDISYADN